MATRRPLHRPQKEKAIESSVPPPEKIMQHEPQIPFHFKLWFFLTLENWLFDFGRPIYALYASDLFPLSRPSIGDYCHMAYNIATALCVLQLLDRCARPVPKILQHVLVAVFVMGASIHLVGDSVQHRLVHIGYKLHLPLDQNPVMSNLQPPALQEFFKLLEFYDEHLGHWIWYVPLFATYVLMFYGGFVKQNPSKIPTSGWLLLLPSALFEWYLVTEGQIFIPYLIMMDCMILIRLFRLGEFLDSNSLWLFLRGMLTMVLIGVWVFYLWDDKELRRKYPGVLYIPEPWSYTSLYIMN